MENEEKQTVVGSSDLDIICADDTEVENLEE